MKSLTILRAWIGFGFKEFPWISKMYLFMEHQISGEGLQ